MRAPGSIKTRDRKSQAQRRRSVWPEGTVPTAPRRGTGRHHSCAQHYIGDIGLVAARVSVNGEGETVDGYHIAAGGGFGATGAIGREILRDVKAQDAPAKVEGLLRAYLARRTGPAETFQDFSARHEVSELKTFAEGQDA
jgi:ferredoxin-nitrite reductase